MCVPVCAQVLACSQERSLIRTSCSLKVLCKLCLTSLKPCQSAAVPAGLCLRGVNATCRDPGVPTRAGPRPNAQWLGKALLGVPDSRTAMSQVLFSPNTETRSDPRLPRLCRIEELASAVGARRDFDLAALLVEIAQDNLYRLRGYRSFGAYVEAHPELYRVGRRQACRLVRGAHVLAHLRNHRRPPSTEKQVTYNACHLHMLASAAPSLLGVQAYHLRVCAGQMLGQLLSRVCRASVGGGCACL